MFMKSHYHLNFKNIAQWLFLFVLLVISMPSKAITPTLIDYNIGDSVQPIPMNNKFIDSNYYIWCGSVLKSDNGKFYMLYSRWPRTDGFYAWCVTSEIAMAVSDKPEGPYKHLKVALPARGLNYWDGSATHNPALTFYKGKYYLYYIGTRSTAVLPRPISASNTVEWYSYRNTQRIGVAVVDSLSGTWTRFDKPVLDVDTSLDTNYDYNLVSNPSAFANDSGKVLLVYKQGAKGATYTGGQIRFGAAFADSPTGPFVKEKKPIFEITTGTTTQMVAEDPYLWWQNGYYYAVVRDVVGKFTGTSGAMALMTSPNGKDWLPAIHPKVISNPFVWEGPVNSVSQLERPCLLFENGKPTYLFGATRADASQSNSFNVAVPLFKQRKYLNKLIVGSAAPQTMDLTWDKSSLATGGYRIERKGNCGEFAQIANVTNLNQTSYSDLQVTGKRLTYRIKYYNAANDTSYYSTEQSAIQFNSTYKNVALGKPTAVSSFSTALDGSKVVDGDIISTESRWVSASGAAYPHWLTIDFQGSYVIDFCRFWSGYGGFYNSPIAAFKIQKWTNNTWKDIITETSNVTSEYTACFANDTISKVRFYVTSGVSGFARVYEFEMYGEAVKTTGFQNASTNSDIDIYPNPSCNELHINGLCTESEYEIVSIDGKKLKVGWTKNYIDTTFLQSGIYILKLKNATCFRFVKK